MNKQNDTPAVDKIASLNRSVDYVSEQAYLVHLGVRPMALVCEADMDDKGMEDALRQLRNVSCWYMNVIPFVIPWDNNPNGRYVLAGYATKRWIIDLLRWTVANAPERYTDYVIGLLLGYSPQAIEEYELRMFLDELTEPPTSKHHSGDNIQ